jgi:SAM-dependent methyltransferase
LLPTSNTSLRVLEIGTGAGGALVPFKEAGCSVLGIDFDEKFLDFGRSKGLSLRIGGIQNLDGSETFDVVILKDVLEHLPDPLQALRMIRESLSERGILYIQVPGLQALGPLGYRYDFLRYLQVAHICHYTIESLTYLCEKSGLLVGYSSNWGIVVCSRNNQPVSTDALAIPSSEIARGEIKRILMRRAVYAIRHEVSSRLPEGVKTFLRSLRSVIVKWRR